MGTQSQAPALHLLPSARPFPRILPPAAKRAGSSATGGALMSPTTSSTTPSTRIQLQDPSLQFVVEIDASDTGVGAVLSQRSPEDQKIHPCAYFSRRLTPAETNYDVGNRELLAVVLALQEWRHWLEGSIHPFVVWTDHKNLSYLQSARRLNSCQAWWALFLGRFQFTLPHRPGSWNVKPDALSRQFTPPVEASPEETILPSSCVVGAARWEIEQVVKEAQCDQLTPENSPPNWLFIPPSARSPVLQWGHASKVACHPGFLWTLTLLRRSFGGQPSQLTPESLSPPAPSVLVANLLIKHLLASYTPCLFLIIPGPTLLWTSLLDSHLQRVTQLF
uniref:uncharacterized protein LOC117264451 n=1 Tax=Epinephelus lanceolatus TaxID=310571 RepID=UPI001446F86D|nr:uncharacterized protein LOC117264451 [Epinephelus lanceolatus]